MALTTIEEYIEDLTKLENHPIGKTQFLNFDFDFMPLNSPIGRFLKSLKVVKYSFLKRMQKNFMTIYVILA